VAFLWIAGCGDKPAEPVRAANPPPPRAEAQPAAQPKAGIPRLLDLGAKSCIPCKMMEPILEELRKEFEGRMTVEFIDVSRNGQAAREHGIRVIPTQIFFDASGKELFRHEGFMSKEDILAKWKELGVEFKAAEPAAFERLEPAKPDSRPKDQVCFMCDGDVNAKTRVTVQTEKGAVPLCCPHCFFIMYSCMPSGAEDAERKALVTDWADGKQAPATKAVYLVDADEKTGRPVVKAFASRDGAVKERAASGGVVMEWGVLKRKELAARCGFCDRAVYPEDAAVVRVDGLYTWGCCAHCSMGVAARTGKDIEVFQPDGLTGEIVTVKTLGGSVASIEPKTSVAWFGQKKTPDGKWVSAGCFHQGFFVNAENLKKWVEGRPYETGRQITIAKSLADKMKMSPQQIQKACKVGECAPK